MREVRYTICEMDGMILLQEVLGRTNRLLSFDMTCTA
jgi:hypothetical protein